MTKVRRGLNKMDWNQLGINIQMIQTGFACIAAAAPWLMVVVGIYALKSVFSGIDNCFNTGNKVAVKIKGALEILIGVVLILMGLDVLRVCQ